MYTLDILGIGNSIREAGRTIALALFDTLLRLIAALYDLFNMIASHRIFDDNVIQTIYTRVGLVLGLFMVFRLTFSAIEYLINPDNITDKQKGIGNIIKKVLIVVILLGSVHFLFNTAYSFQDLLLNDENNVISKVILGNSKTTGMSAETDISWAIFSSFFKSTGPETSTCSKYLDEDNSAGIKADFDNYYKTAFSTLSFKKAYECVNEKKGEDWAINFEWFYGICTALFVGYVLCVYIIQLGVRSVQLAYLELIAPIPIMMYLNPKGDETLKKWGKQCLSTYLDVFIRVAILYFILLAFKAITEADLFATGSIPVGIVLLIGLMMFAKKGPDLIKEIFPSTGSKASLGFGMKLKEGLTAGTGATIGAVGGLATGIKYGKGTAGGRLGGAITGLARGALGGAKSKGNIFANASKGMANQRVAMQRAYNRNNDGSDFWGRTIGAGDAARTKAAFDEELSFYDAYTKNADLVDSELAKNANVKAILAEQQALMSRGESGGPIPTAAEIASMDSRVKAVKQTALQNEMNRRGTADENKVLIAALDNAEAMRKKAVKSNYAGFEKYHETSVLDYSDNFLDSVKEVKNETRNIKDPSGSRNEAYKKAEANAKYAKDK